jgi:hypothetical protein
MTVHTAKIMSFVTVLAMTIVPIDQQNVGKKSLHLIKTPKRDEQPFTAVSTIFDREPHNDSPC